MADDVVEKLILVISRLGKDDPLYNADTFKTILKVVVAALLSPADPRSHSHIYTVINLVTFLAGQSDLTLNDTNKICSGDQARDQVFKDGINRKI